MPEITSAWVFYGAAAALVLYVLFMMVRKPRAERRAGPGRPADTEL
jgi:hypothetical protein